MTRKKLLDGVTLILKLKRGKAQEDTIIRIGRNKAYAFNAKIALMKRKKLDAEIDLFDLATDSKNQLIKKRKFEET